MSCDPNATHADHLPCLCAYDIGVRIAAQLALIAWLIECEIATSPNARGVTSR